MYAKLQPKPMQFLFLKLNFYISLKTDTKNSS